MGPGERLVLALTKKYGFEAEVPFYGLDEWKRTAKTKALRTPYRWDAGIPGVSLAVEYQGYGPGHHTRQKMARDARKLCEGQLSGWTVIVCTQETVDDGSCLTYIERALAELGISGPWEG